MKPRAMGASESLGIPFSTGLPKADATDDVSPASLLVPTLPLWLWASGSASLDLRAVRKVLLPLRLWCHQEPQIPTHRLSRGEGDRARLPPK